MPSPNPLFIWIHAYNSYVLDWLFSRKYYTNWHTWLFAICINRSYIIYNSLSRSINKRTIIEMSDSIIVELDHYIVSNIEGTVRVLIIIKMMNAECISVNMELTFCSKIHYRERGGDTDRGTMDFGITYQKDREFCFQIRNGILGLPTMWTGTCSGGKETVLPNMT